MNLIEFIHGATFIALAGSALFFFRYWQHSSDSLFANFCAAFAMFALSTIMVFFLGESADFIPFAYGLRLGGFVLIILAIVQKNLKQKNDKH